ncbi:MAG: WecB/TagA/CpsF family glycosyltransferase [Ginsengibacter sp.]
MDINKKQLFSVSYSITDYGTASDIIIQKARARESFGVSALAVHGLIESVRHKSFRECLEQIDMIVPDGQPIKWALNSFYKVGLKERVAGPILTKHVLAKASDNHLKVYLYGSKISTLNKMQEFFNDQYPHLEICGMHSDRFRDATPEEDAEDIKKINDSGANLVLVGRGCPRQEKWVAGHISKIHAPMMAIGAAFDFMAGNIKHAPHWMQRSGLEWLYRLVQDPKKLWRRYLTTNMYFIYLFILCKSGIRSVQF